MLRNIVLVVALLFCAGVATHPAPAGAEMLYQCQLNQTMWSDWQNCENQCASQRWVVDITRPNGGYWDTTFYGCRDVPNGGAGGGGGGSGGGGGGGGGGPSGPFYQGQCDYNVMCPGANSCMCKATGGEEQTT